MRDIRVEMVQVIRVIRTVGKGTENDPVRREVQYWEPDGKLIVAKDWQGDMSPWRKQKKESMSKESPEIDVERMQELLRSTPLTCIPIEKPEEIQESVDAVIRALSEDIICTIGRENGIQCAKEVEEKTLTMATLVNMRIALGKSELLETGKGGK